MPVRLWLAISVLILSLALPSSASIKTLVSFDGLWWTGLSSDEKIIAVQAMEVGYDSGSREACKRAAKYLYKTRYEAKDKRAGPTLTACFNAGTYEGRTFERAMQELDKAFVGRPAFSEFPVSRFVPCAILSGKNCDETIHLYQSDLGH